MMDVIGLVARVVVNLVLTVPVVKFFLKKERRLYKNISRPILLLEASEGGLKREERIVNGTKIMKTCGRINYSLDPDAILNVNNERAIVIQYSKSNTFNDLINRIRDSHLPVVVLSRAGEIKDVEILKKIQGYSYGSIANTPTRLLSDLFALMNIMPEDK